MSVHLFLSTYYSFINHRQDFYWTRLWVIQRYLITNRLCLPSVRKWVFWCCLWEHGYYGVVCENMGILVLSVKTWVFWCCLWEHGYFGVVRLAHRFCFVCFILFLFSFLSFFVLCSTLSLSPNVQSGLPFRFSVNLYWYLADRYKTENHFDLLDHIILPPG